VGAANNGTPVAGTTVTQTQASSTAASWAYAIGSENDFAAGQIAWGYFNASNVFVGTSQTLASPLVLGLSGTVGKKVKVEVVDESGAVKSFYVTLTAGVLNYSFDLTGLGKIGLINFVVDQKNGGASGTINVTTSGLLYIPSAPTTAAAVTPLPGTPSAASLVGAANNGTPVAGTTVTQTQASSTAASWAYAIGSENDFAAGQIAWGYFNASNVFVGTSQTLASPLVLGLSGTVGKKVKVEVVDESGAVKSFYVTLTAGVLNYSFDLTGLGKIGLINFVVDQKNGGASGTINVTTSGLLYTPMEFVLGASYNQSLISVLPDSPVVVSSHGTTTATDNSTISTSQTSETIFSSTSTNPDVGDFTFSQISWGYFTDSTTFVGAGAMLEDSLTLALEGTAGQTLKIEFISASNSNTRKTFFVTLSATHQNFTFDLTGFGSVGLINFVHDREGVTDYTVETKGLAYAPVEVVAGDLYNPEVFTSLENYYPVTFAGGGNTVEGQTDAILNYTQLSSVEFEYDYDLSVSSSSFTYAGVSPGFFDDQGVFQGVAMDLSQNYVFAARGSDGGRVKVEVVDVNRVKATFVLLLSPTYQNYTLILSGGNVPEDFDSTQVAEIVFVQDRNIGSPFLNDFVSIQTAGLDYAEALLPDNMQEIKDTLVASGLDYFELGAGIDPVTHFPYDNQSSDGTFAHFTQPTLIGFYAQILGDAVNGELNNGMNAAQALSELDLVITNLQSFQSEHGWNGLIPWMDLNTGEPANSYVAFLDNANMAQSLAVMVGALQSAGLSGADLTKANQIISKTEQFLDAQAPGYQAFVNPEFGVFHMSYDRNTGLFSSFVDRLASEVRGAVAFVQVRYPSIPVSVWDNLEIKTANYTDSQGNVIENVVAWDGAAFQMFWPSLRNDERSFIGFRNMLYNQLISQMDWAAQNNLPGILSASALPEGGYYGAIGVPGLAEQTSNPTHIASYYDTVVMNTGSTYALAAAYSIDRYAVLGWLDAFDNAVGLNNLYGFYDAARSSTEIAHEYIGIDVASAVLGLGGNGPKDFEAYLRNKGLETAYNLLYDRASKKLELITRTTAGFPNAPTIPDRSFSVFNNLDPAEREGAIASFPDVYVTGATGVYGAQFKQTSPLSGGWGGHYWMLDQAYDAQANQFVIHYTTADTPQAIKLEFKNASGQVLYTTTQTLADDVRFGRLVIQLPNQTLLNEVKEVDLVVDQNATGDTSFDFTIHSLMFQHFVSTQSLMPDEDLGVSDVTDLPPTGVGYNTPNSTVQPLLPKGIQFHFDLTGVNTYAATGIDYDPEDDGSSVDLSAFSEIVFGLDSAKAKMVKIEIEDASGKRAVYYAQNVDVSRNYYKFLSASAAGSVDLTHVRSVNIVVDKSCIDAGDEIGDLSVEIGGLS
jgi:hypothetical protein